MAFYESTWFVWSASIIAICSVFAVFWKSFVEESDYTWSDIGSFVFKMIAFIPMIIVGAIWIAIEKRYWGALFIAIVLGTMFVVVFILDPGGSPGGSFYDD